MINLTHSIFLYKEGWNELSWLNIIFVDQPKARIQIISNSEAPQGTDTIIESGRYDVTVDLNSQEGLNAPFKLKKYTTIKLFNEESRFIIAVSNSEENNKIEQILAKLIYYTKFLKSSIIREVQLNIADALLDAFVTALRQKYPSKDRETKGHSLKLFDFLSSIGADFGKELPIEDIRNIAYKSMIYQGLFPVDVQLKYSNDGYLKKWLQRVLYDERTPWSSSFASEIRIGREVFKDHRTTTNKRFLKIRILDFFPLDSWVDALAEYLASHLDRLILDLKGALDPVIERMPSNSTDSMMQPLLGRSNSSNSDIAKDHLFKLFKSHGAAELYSKIADQFFSCYYAQLSESKSFQQISKVIASSMKEEMFYRDPNQLVSNTVYVIHDGLKKITEPLTLDPKLRSEFETQVRELEKAENITAFRKAADRIDHEKFDLYTKYATQRDLLCYIPPVVADELLDYFGFYTDTLTKTFFEIDKRPRHNTPKGIWEEFKSLKGDPNMYEHRYQLAQSYFEGKSSKHVIEKKEVKAICFLILVYLNEKGERQKDMCKNLLFWYYNSVRLRNSYKYNKLVSYIGFVVVKDTI